MNIIFKNKLVPNSNIVLEVNKKYRWCDNEEYQQECMNTVWHSGEVTFSHFHSNSLAKFISFLSNFKPTSWTEMSCILALYISQEPEATT